MLLFIRGIIGIFGMVKYDIKSLSWIMCACVTNYSIHNSVWACSIGNFLCNDDEIEWNFQGHYYLFYHWIECSKWAHILNFLESCADWHSEWGFHREKFNSLNKFGKYILQMAIVALVWQHNSLTPQIFQWINKINFNRDTYIWNMSHSIWFKSMMISNFPVFDYTVHTWIE